MKILILADPSAAHTKKWANALAAKGLDVYIFGLNVSNPQEYPDIPPEHFFIHNMGETINNKPDGNLSKLKYLKVLPAIKKIIMTVRPDILHSYYASSYGLLGALTNFRPFLVSVWGSDIYSFPQKSVLHKKVIKYVFHKSSMILSTSNVMAGEIQKYTNNDIKIIPFGIDLKKFQKGRNRNIFSDKDIVIGTVKKLEKNYAVDVLIKAFHRLKNLPYGNSLKLLIVGGGIEKNNLENLTKEMGLQDSVHFTGWVPYNQIQEYHKELDIAAYLSINESFGVSILESFACGVPVVASDAVGFKEIVVPNENGIIVEKNNIDETVSALRLFIENKELREQFGENAREYVTKIFNLDENVAQTINLYNNIV
jgi:glycosyltransferase involved in cell wall biosynthesis